MMKVIGLAGRAGSGKSTVARFLAQHPGIEWIDLDAVAWSTYARGTDVYDRLVAAFGRGILNEVGDIDRIQLANIAFKTHEAQQTLNEVVHPAVSDAVHAIIQMHRAEGTEILLVEGALLATSPHVDRSIYDMILWLETTDNSRSERLQAAGRGDHAKRGRDVFPTGTFIAVPNEGSVEEAADCILHMARGDRG